MIHYSLAAQSAAASFGACGRRARRLHSAAPLPLPPFSGSAPALTFPRHLGIINHGKSKGADEDDLYHRGFYALVIRPIKCNEIMLLTDFIYESIFQKGEARPAPRTIIQKPSIWIYIDEFGSKKDDHCLVAEIDGVIVGAVWVRCIKGFGYVDDTTPEFAISVYPQYRGKGIGGALMKEMLAHLRAKGYAKASLSVQKANYAVRMYQKIGFETIDENDEDYIMLYSFR